MPKITKTSASKTKTTRVGAESWLEGKEAKSTKTKAKPARKTAAKKPVAKKVVRKTTARKVVRKTPVKRTRRAAAAKSTSPVKAVRTKMGRMDLLNHLTEASGLQRGQVKVVLDTLKDTMLAHIAPRGAGEFVMPGMFKVVTKKIPAKKVAAIKKGTEVRNPRTGEVSEHPGRKAYVKPATVKVRIRPMKAMKDVAIGV